MADFRCHGVTSKSKQRCQWRTQLFTDGCGGLWCIYHYYDNIQLAEKRCHMMLDSGQRCQNDVVVPRRSVGGEPVFVCTSHLNKIPRRCNGFTVRHTRCRRREGLMDNKPFVCSPCGDKYFCSVAHLNSAREEKARALADTVEELGLLVERLNLLERKRTTLESELS